MSHKLTELGRLARPARLLGEHVFGKLCAVSCAHISATLPRAMGKAGSGTDAPVGWYLAADVAQLAGVVPRSIVEWTKHGYIEPHRDVGPPHVFSYQDVAEAMAVHELLERGVPRAELRMAIKNLRRDNANWPLQSSNIGLYEAPPGTPRRTPKRARIGLRGRDGTYDVGQIGGRQKFLEYDELVQLAELLRRGGWVIRLHPDIKHVEVDPEKQSGKPTIRGRRIPVEDVATMAREGDRRILRVEFGLSRAEIDDAIKWSEAVAELSKAA